MLNDDMFHITRLVTGSGSGPWNFSINSPSRSLTANLFTWKNFSLININIHQGCGFYSRGLDSVRACRRRCSPSPLIYCSPPHEDGTSLTSAGSCVSLQPSGVRIKSEVGVMETSRCIAPSSGSLIMQNRAQVNDFSMMRETAHISHCVKEAKA